MNNIKQLGLFTAMCATLVLAQNPYENNLAKTPPMGWNSWNCCGGSNEAQVKAITDTMVSSGMKAAGYEYVVIDDGWATARDAQGNIGVNTTLFPSGIKALADYIHARGLKFGIYTSRGDLTCGGAPGSAGYETRDAQQYAAWGADFVKADGCANNQQNTRVIAAALVATGRPIVLSTNTWSYGDGIDTVANMWRIRNDIAPVWSGNMSMIDMVDVNKPLWPVARPGHWNDPDMLQVGNGSLSLEENKTHFAMWCMMAAPLLAGNNLTTMTRQIRDILVHDELIAIDQDSLGLQARIVMKQDSVEVWVKVLRDSSRAVALLNRGPSTVRAGFNLAQLGWWPGMICPVRNVWKKTSQGSVSDTFSDTVPSHGTAVFRVTKGADVRGPRITRVYNDTTMGRIFVVFDEPLDPATAQTASNYTLDNGATVSGAVITGDGRTVVLTTSTLTQDRVYAVTVNNVRDLSANAAAAGADAQFTAAGRTPQKLTGALFGAGEPFSGNAALDYPAAVDGSLATFSDLTSRVPLSPLYVGYDLGAGNECMITAVSYAPRPSFTDRMKGMQVQGSNDRWSWTTLYTITTTPAAGSLTRQAVAGTSPFRYVRLEGTEGFLNVAEVEFYGYGVGTTMVKAGAQHAMPRLHAGKQTIAKIMMRGAPAANGLAVQKCYDMRGVRIALDNRGTARSASAGILIIRP